MAPQDARFARLKTDPRFRRPKQKHLKAEIDERFKDALSEDFGSISTKARVDKRGRALTSTSGADSMKRFYRLASSDEEKHIDYARGEGALDSSGSEDEESEVEEDELELGGKRKMRFLPSDSESESDDEEAEVDLDSADEGQMMVNLDEDDLEGQEEEEEEEEEEEGADPTTRIAAVNLDWDHLRAADVFTIFNSFLKAPPTKKGEATPPPPGRLLSVRIYPSEFGKERMAQEDAAGPGGGLWKKLEKANKRSKKQRSDDSASEGESEEDSEEDGEKGSGDEEDQEEEGEESGEEGEGAGEGEDEEHDSELEDDGLDADLDDLEVLSDVSNDGSEDIDMDQLRKYQLERLRYYYAIATFSNVAAAELVHDELNGTEFERTANILDLSYVPDGMEFEESEVHDECTKEPKAYKGNEFVTDALRHSKVKLTWDQDDPNRAKVTRRALTREEIEDEDFGNLVAGSDSDDSEPELEPSASANEQAGEGANGAKKSKKEIARERKEKLRTLLLSGDTGDIWGKAGAAWQEELADIREGRDHKKKEKAKSKADEVEITFKPALAVAPPADEENMTSLEKYQLRMKEKKRAKKDKLSAKAAGRGEEGDEETLARGDDFFGDDESDDAAAPPPPDAKKGKKEGKKAGKKAEEKNEVIFDADGAGLVDDPTRHFDLKDLLTTEKEEGKKRKRHRKKGGKETKELELGPDGFAASVDVADPRFAAIYDEPTFAIDPTHSKFTDTSVNREILKRAREGHAKSREGGKGKESGEGEKGLDELVASVKATAGRARKRSRKH